MSSPGTLSRRRESDVMKLMMGNFDVNLNADQLNDFVVTFAGPRDSPYEGGVWRVHVVLPDMYPYKSPSIGFLNRIFHPNIDEASGTVCLDVINQTWSPMFDLVNIFEVFLPQLLLYPNPTDPLNGEAAALMLREPERYRARIVEYVQKYASAPTQEVVLDVSSDEDGGDDDDDCLGAMDQDEGAETTPIGGFM
eukprot:gnl/Spiro4/27648_TR13771_c0_g1_i1.p1 gnl/Spiro4/27648_TR13771_c0_g1~~gnl/Spiro4/27648_TR13771_c0_g1_i1.p1  ORF type:complete len:220 (+),score=59.59 gnl/Spiro4/27648_TR13771_c0_g1_i1:80-661(+)